MPKMPKEPLLASVTEPAGVVYPARHQPELQTDRFILPETPDAEAVPMDVVFVGAGPAGLAGAIELARLVKAGNEAGDWPADIEIGVLEKAEGLGEHNLSGAVINPRSFRALFPGRPDADFPFRRSVEREAVYFLRERGASRIPTPPTMRNRGNYVASICEVVRWLGERAEELGVAILPGFPVASLLVDGQDVVGVRTTPSGLDRKGRPDGPNFMPAVDVAARVTVLCEGTRGALSQAYLNWQGIESANPQIYSLGVKELWEVDKPLDRVLHTVGWPLLKDGFGGSFAYPLDDRLVALGLVVSLDYANARLDVHGQLQRLKHHSLFRNILEGGRLLEWGAKTIPEGGYYSLPARSHGGGICITGDAAGYVDVPSLKGIHYAMYSGILAARAIYGALKADDVSARGLAPYTSSVNGSFIVDDLKRRRNLRLPFKNGFYTGALKAGLATLTGGWFPGGLIRTGSDASEAKHLLGTPVDASGSLAVSKVDAVYRSGNRTRDDIPSHLSIAETLPPEAVEMYVHLCPAGVYEREGDRLVVNPANCIDCKATDILGPRWRPREGGSGPRYRRM